jgi:hypothetical protein
MGKKKSKRGRARKPVPKQEELPEVDGPRRFPPITVFFLGLVVGYLVASYWGALMGGAIGFFLWRSRA